MAAEKRSKLYQVSLIFACGTALFSDGYANTVLTNVLRRVYGADNVAAGHYSDVVNSLGFAGTVVGMLAFGYISDQFGRKFGMMSATALVVIFSCLAAASSGGPNGLHGMLIMLSICRFFLGIGVGAEYPCGSVAASEQSEEDGISKNARHRWVALSTNTMISFGFVTAAFVPLVLFWIFGSNHLRAVWRLSLGLGAVPATGVFLWRLRMDEPSHYKRNCMARTKFPYWLVFKRYWVSLTGISLVWCLYDFIVYPFGIYSSTIIDNITNHSDSLTQVLGWAVVINLFYLPGNIVGAYIVDYLGPKKTMVLGLICQGITGFIMSGLYPILANHIAAFVVVYGIFLSFGAFGAGNGTIILAAKSGPTGVRAQFYSVASATGKVGAFIGIWAFPPMIDAFGGPNTERGNSGPFWVASGLAVLGALIAFFMIKELDRDGISREDEAFRGYLEEHGYDTSMLGLLTEDESLEVPSSDEKSEPIIIQGKSKLDRDGLSP